MKKTFLIILSLLFPFLLVAQSKARVPLGQYDQVHLGMTAAEVEEAYNCKVVKRGPVGGLISHSEKFNIETSHVTIRLDEIDKGYKLKGLEFTEMHLEFINQILMQIKFITSEECLKDEEEAKAIINLLKVVYNNQYKGYKEYAPPSHHVNDFSYSVAFSTEKLVSQKIGKGLNSWYKEMTSSQGNLLQFSYAIKAPRKVKKPYYGGKITLKMRLNEEINYWKFFVKLMESSQAAGLKPINTFRNKNLGTSLVAFKAAYANTIVPYDPQKNASLGGLTSKHAAAIEVYTLSDEQLSLLDHQLEGIYYIFYEDKLQSIWVNFDTMLPMEEFKILRENIKTVFGKPTYEFTGNTGGVAEADFWSGDHLKKNFGEDYFTSLEESYGGVPKDYLADMKIGRTNSMRETPTMFRMNLSDFFTKLSDRAKQNTKKTLQSDF